VGRPLCLLCGHAVAEISGLPLEWLCRFFIQADVAHDLAVKIGNRNEDAAIDHISLQFREPSFDLVESRRMGRGEVEFNVGMLR
jgi:hypothetical protein